MRRLKKRGTPLPCILMIARVCCSRFLALYTAICAPPCFVSASGDAEPLLLDELKPTRPVHQYPLQQQQQQQQLQPAYCRGMQVCYGLGCKGAVRVHDAQTIVRGRSGLVLRLSPFSLVVRALCTTSIRPTFEWVSATL